MIIDQWKQTARLYEIQVKFIFSHTILVAVLSECRVKGYLYNLNWDIGKQNAASDQGLHCFLKLQEVKG